MSEKISALIVDDNAAFLATASLALRSIEPRCEVHTAASVRGALALLDASGDPLRPRAAILDYHLPDLDAPVLLQWLRAQRGLGNLPVLVLSQANGGEAATALAAGGDRFAVKPSRAAALREMLAAFWEECVAPTFVAAADDAWRRILGTNAAQRSSGKHPDSVQSASSRAASTPCPRKARSLG